MDGTAWSGQDGPRLNAQLRYASNQLPEGWLLKVQQSEASGSFAYRKRSGTYDYSERGHFTVDPKWRSGRPYIGLLKAGDIFCVANPEQQSGETEDTATDMMVITYMTVYDYCVQLRSQ
jgi:hypothetical protein